MDIYSNDNLRGFTHDELSAAFSYDPESGIITRNATGEALRGSPTWYVQVQVETHDGSKIGLYGHRLAWFLHHGWIDPTLEIDHINGHRSDNRLINLRLVTRSVNMRNKRLRSDNSSGHPGVIYSKARDKWLIVIGGKYFGSDKRKHMAIRVAKQLYELAGYGPSHGKDAA